jgi:oxygen-dependent protoporphyrinogen oxidase
VKAKLGFLIGAAAGYVLGARSGRERYEDMKLRAQRVWNDPRVQQKAEEAKQTAKAKAPEVQHKVSEAASHAASATKSKLRREDSGEPAADDLTGADDLPGAERPAPGVSYG